MKNDIFTWVTISLLVFQIISVTVAFLYYMLWVHVRHRHFVNILTCCINIICVTAYRTLSDRCYWPTVIEGEEVAEA